MDFFSPDTIVYHCEMNVVSILKSSYNKNMILRMLTKIAPLSHQTSAMTEMSSFNPYSIIFNH